MELYEILLALNDNNLERNSVDPRGQLFEQYRELRALRSAVLSLEGQIRQEALEEQARKEELEQLVLQAEKWDLAIKQAKGKVNRQKGLTLKDMMMIQQEVVRLEDRKQAGEWRVTDLQNQQALYESERRPSLTRLKEMKARYNRIAETYNQDKAESDALIGSYASKEDELLKELKPVAQAMYRQALKSNPENPIALLEGEICGGCRIGLSIYLVKQIRQGNQVIACENCSRILLP